jgi:hypothetical protein
MGEEMLPKAFQILHFFLKKDNKYILPLFLSERPSTARRKISAIPDGDTKNVKKATEVI